jgi:hypothetical protein
MYQRIKEIVEDYANNKPRKDRQLEEISLIHQDVE